MNLDPNFLIHDEAALKALYGEPGEASIVKEKGHITPEYRALIEASPFAVLATSGPDGLDASPRGDLPHLVTVEDEKTILMPDRRGNNRIDTLRNIVTDPRVALLFLIPGSGTTLRLNGIALVSVDPALIARFTVEGKAPAIRGRDQGGDGVLPVRPGRAPRGALGSRASRRSGQPAKCRRYSRRMHGGQLRRQDV